MIFKNQNGARGRRFVTDIAQKRSGCDRLDLGRQTALVARGLVLVNNFLVGDTIDHGHGFLINALSSSLVASDNRLLYTLDSRTQSGTQTGVVGALLDSLACTLAGLCTIGHKS